MVPLGAFILNRLALPIACLLTWGGYGGAVDATGCDAADTHRGGEWNMTTRYAGPGGGDKSKLKISIGPSSAVATEAASVPAPEPPALRPLRPPPQSTAQNAAAAIPTLAEHADTIPTTERAVFNADGAPARSRAAYDSRVYTGQTRNRKTPRSDGDPNARRPAAPQRPISEEKLRELLAEDRDPEYRRQWPFNGEEWQTKNEPPDHEPKPGSGPGPKSATPTIRRKPDPLPDTRKKGPDKRPAADNGDHNRPLVSDSSLYGELLHGMLAISPHEFEKPAKSVPMTLREVSASVLKNNRTIQAAAFKPEQARAGIMEAKSVYDPTAFADWTHSRTDAEPAMIISGYSFPNREFRNEVGRAGIKQHLPSGGDISTYREWNSGIERNPGSDPDRGHGGAYVMGISQPLLNGFLDAENRTVLEISRLQYDMSNEEFRQTVMETMSDAFEAYWTVALARENVRINQECLDMAERLLERESGRKDEGIANELDVNRAREAVATRAYNLLLSREQHLQAQEDLKYKINDRAAPVGMDVHVEVIEPLDMPLMKVDIEKTIDSALRNRPEMHNADLAIRATAARRRFAKHSLLPEVNLTGSIRHNDRPTTTPTSSSSTANTGTDWSVGLAFSMPLGNMEARANLRRTEAEMSQYQEEKRNMRDLIITEIRSIGKSMELIVREIPQNRRAMEAAAKVLEGEWAKLELNQTGNRDLLQAQDLVAVAEKNYIQSLVRYNVYIVQLLASEGVLLEKMGIRLRAK